MTDAFSRGRFVWYELSTSDPVGGTALLHPADRLDHERGHRGRSALHGVGERRDHIGGVMQLTDEAKKAGAPPHWLAYVSVPSVDETLQQAEGLGAKKLMGPMDIPTVGRFAVIQDPQGAVLAIYTAAGDAPDHDGEPAIGEFSWHELSTLDYAAAFDFYSALFGWVKIEAMDMGPGGIYQMYGRVPGAVDRRHVQQADRPAGAAGVLAVLRDGPRCAREGRAGEAAWRSGAQRPDGSAGRRFRRAVHGPAGRCLCDPLAEAVRLSSLTDC